MVDFKEITHEHWELFTRDFLEKLGFYIETPPDRGPDGGKDILVTENITGAVHKGRFRWLISCKQLAVTGNSVTENDEPNILERVLSFKANGFMGVYSTLSSSGLNTRLRQLKEENLLADYKIFDGKLIENYLVTVGYSDLMLRYFPESYKKIKPLHKITDEYISLKCDHCKKDVLELLFKEEYSANVCYCLSMGTSDGKDHIEEVYCACKGDCDRALERSVRSRGMMVAWHDISDVVIPLEYLRWTLAMVNRIREGRDIYKDEAYEKQKHILIAIAQKTLRFTTESERQRVKDLMSLGF